VTKASYFPWHLRPAVLPRQRQERDGRNPGTDGEHKNTEQVLCQEYVLQGDRIVYHIRPTDSKHPQLLPVGDNVQYRTHKDKMYVLNSEGDTKEREYSVISMQIRQDVKDARNTQ